MSIASKEARESNYWLRLLDKSDYLNNYPNKLVLFNMSQSIVKLLKDTTLIFFLLNFKSLNKELFIMSNLSLIEK